MRASILLSAAVAALALAATPSHAGIFDKEQKAQAQIPICSRNLGTIAIREPDHNWWTDANLASPELLLKVFVRQSRCFTLVDRGKGFELAQQERELAAGGALRRGSNIGKGQVRAADYVLVPDIASKNEDAGGKIIGAIIGGLLGAATHSRTVGAVASSISLSSKTADVLLSIVDVRTSEDGPIEQGHGEKTDLSFGAGGFGLGASGFAGAAVSSYEHTDIGQVLILAYIDAYTKLVTDMGGQPAVPVDPSAASAPAPSAADKAVASANAASPLPANASAAAPAQAYSMARIGHLFKSDTSKSKPLRTLAAGAFVYPTGVQSGEWLQVKDEMGTSGWVRVDLLAIAK
jgi:curli biogenesis system outer membrane secretion channel CsgG